MACQIAGIEGWGGAQAILFSAPPLPGAGIAGWRRPHRHQRMPMRPGPGSTLEVIEAEFLLHLLVGRSIGSTTCYCGIGRRHRPPPSQPDDAHQQGPCRQDPGARRK